MESMEPSAFQLVLATDLDGTFLEGDQRTKSFLYNQLVRLREQVMLIYVTGRPISIVSQFCRQGYLPSPHFVIGDHGTHIVDGSDFQPVTHLQTPIVEKWNNGNHRIRTLLQDDAGIQLQPLDPPYRVAYYYDPQHFQTTTVDKIIHAGFDAILSCDMYLDIVPKGVNKGSSLLNLLNDLGITHERVITAGDSLNDLSLFQTGLKSIVVGNAEPKLLIQTRALTNVYHSNLPGVPGIIEGFKFYEKLHLFNLDSN
jgi:HAD superfamily hydrolase (TIGR01484 family)